MKNIAASLLIAAALFVGQSAASEAQTQVGNRRAGAIDHRQPSQVGRSAVDQRRPGIVPIEERRPGLAEQKDQRRPSIIDERRPSVIDEPSVRPSGGRGATSAR